MDNKFNLNEEQLQDCINLATGLFYPLNGFMNSTDYHNVIKYMKLSNNDVWTIPITLDVDHKTFAIAQKKESYFIF